MTTTAARPHTDEDNEWRHGPVAAPFNTAAGALVTTAIGKTLGMPPWVAFLATAVMTGAVIWSGLHHQPRPLSRMSIVFRSIAVTACGGWMWWQLATFPDLGLSSDQTVVLVVAWPLTILAGVGCLRARRLPALIRIATPGILLMFTVALTLVLGEHVASWLHNVLFVTDPMPKGWAPASAWLGQSLLQLLILAAPMAVIGRHTANREETIADEAERAAAASVPANTPEARRFLKLVCDTTNEYRTLPSIDRSMPAQKYPLLSIVSVDPWENGAGETYKISLVDGKNTTVDSLRSHTTLWATKMALDNGCGIEVHHDTESRGAALVKISRKNVLKEKIPYPDLLPRSIMNAMPLGRTRDGVEIGPFFRENSCFLWGQKGSGKTGTVFDIIAGGLQCTDALVWVIDLNGGAAGKPFLRPWSEGKVDRPCVDWVACTESEILAMSQVGLDIAVDRKVHYADLKYEYNTNLMPVGNGETGNPPPEILIVIDEGATVLGMGGGQVSDTMKQAKHNLNQIMDLARDAAVNIVFSGLRATQDVADSAFKAGTSIRIGMRVTDANELAYGFGRYDLNPADIPEKGSGFICTGHDENEVQVFKAYFLDPSRNYEVGLVTTPWRPYMDARGIQIGGAQYANRWARTAPRLWEPGPKMSEEQLDRLCSYGALPVSADQRSAAANAGATATAERPSSGINTALYQPAKPGEMSYDDVLRMAEQAAQAFDAGLPPPVMMPPGPTGGQPQAGPPPAQPPSGGGGQEPAQPEEPDETGDLDDEDDNGVPEFQRRFAELAAQLESSGGVLPSNPEDLRGNPIPLPPDSELEANPRSEEVVERLILAHGPLGISEIHKMLNAGGAWGPATKMTSEGLRLLLRRVNWLAPRSRGAKYNHRNNVK